ncbi:MAG: hypothetical protein ACRD1T_05695 [Acidimicrobiia bacterium]
MKKLFLLALAAGIVAGGCGKSYWEPPEEYEGEPVANRFEVSKVANDEFEKLRIERRRHPGSG